MSKTTLRLCLTAALLTSCATSGQKADPVECVPDTKVVTQTRVVDTSCEWAEPIYVSKADVLSDATAKAILSHNKTGAAKCGWKPSSK